ncbi:transcription factor ORG2-like isoform X2 [Nymphaea colorata]|nr:transcription factor ORG2-like isoform X2 [Nymphaea colorata]
MTATMTAQDLYTYIRAEEKPSGVAFRRRRMFIQPPAGLPSSSCAGEDWMFCGDTREVEDLSCISWGAVDAATFRDPSFQLSSYGTPAFDDAQGSCTMDGDQHTVAKKLSHNANERYRRKRMNSLYSSLRSLLPNADQTKKLSVPATVSRALKYIPELQKQVESLIQKRRQILERISRHENGKSGDMNNIDPLLPVAPLITATRVHDNELLVQVSTSRRQGYHLSELVRNLEEEGLQLLNASTFGSGEGRVFYSLYLKMEDKCTKMDSEAIRQKLILLSGTRGAK